MAYFQPVLDVQTIPECKCRTLPDDQNIDPERMKRYDSVSDANEEVVIIAAFLIPSDSKDYPDYQNIFSRSLMLLQPPRKAAAP